MATQRTSVAADKTGLEIAKAQGIAAPRAEH
jgi:hypothetical protein